MNYGDKIGRWELSCKFSFCSYWNGQTKLSNLISRQRIFPTATVPYYTKGNFYSPLNNGIIAQESKPGSVLKSSCALSVSAEGGDNRNSWKERESQ